MKQNKQTIKNMIVVLIVFIILMGVISFALYPYFDKLRDPVARESFKVWIKSRGIWGYIIVVGIQMLQIIIAFVPGEPVEIMAGLLYGGLGGFVICTIGSILASSAVFLFSKKVGVRIITKIFGKNKLEEFQFLHNSHKRELVLFILFLIPGTPKDMLTYVVGATPIKLSRFLVITTIARIPSVITSTYIGFNLIEGNWVQAIILFGITAIIGVVGIIYKERIINACRKIGRKIKMEKEEFVKHH